MPVRKFKTLAATRLTLAATILAFVFLQTAPALAYGPGNGLAGRNSVGAIVNFRIPLGTSQADKDHAPSFGFTVQRQFQFNDPLYETFSGSYRNSSSITVDVMDLRFGMNGKLSGFDVGGLNALQAKTLLNAADNEDEEALHWAWWAIGVPVLVVGGLYLIDEFLACNEEFRRCR